MDSYQRPGKALTLRILDLGRQIDEIERVLATWPSADEEVAFVRALSASVDRLRGELGQARTLLERHDATGAPADGPDGTSDAMSPESSTPQDSANSSTRAASSPQHGEPFDRSQPPGSRVEESAPDAPTERTIAVDQSGRGPKRIFHFPGGRDVEITEAEWQEIQALLNTRSSGSTSG